MGIDCSLFTENGKYGLDRWYVFSPEFEHGKIYSKKEFITLLDKCSEYHLDDFIENSKEEQIQNKEHILYCLNWIHEAKINVGEENAILNDQYDGYYDYDILNDKLKRKLSEVS